MRVCSSPSRKLAAAPGYLTQAHSLACLARPVSLCAQARRLLALWEVLHDVAPLVHLAAVDERPVAEDLLPGGKAGASRWIECVDSHYETNCPDRDEIVHVLSCFSTSRRFAP